MRMPPASIVDTGFAYKPPAPIGGGRPARVVWPVRALPAFMAAALLILPEQASNSASFETALPTLSGRGVTSGFGNNEIVPSTESEAFAIAAAAPFVASYGDAASPSRAEDCLTQAIYYEGALEPELGQRAIAQVVLNRVRHPQYPNSVCGVVFQGSHLPTGCQFTFTCDGSRGRPPAADLWRRANLVAKAALGGLVTKDVGLATHYHADYVQPYWSSSLDHAGKIGRHIFYRWRGSAGMPQAFSSAYAGREPMVGEWVGRAAANSDPASRAIAYDAAAGGSFADALATEPQPAEPVVFKARPLQLAAADRQPE
jgi:spore germination cell wall hydrolase CwlJ-like protein